MGGYEFMNGRLTLGEVSERVGVTARTIRRWEASRKVKRAKRDWRGWRVYEHEDIEELIEFHDTVS
jgi:DNA-binding transcriptional MerR regulator